MVLLVLAVLALAPVCDPLEGRAAVHLDEATAEVWPGCGIAQIPYRPFDVQRRLAVRITEHGLHLLAFERHFLGRLALLYHSCPNALQWRQSPLASHGCPWG